MNGNKKKEKAALDLVPLIIFLYIPTKLFMNELYISVCIYIVVVSASATLNWVNRLAFQRRRRAILTERKKIKHLEYYYITDEYKKIDLEKRYDTFSLFTDMTIEGFVAISINFAAFYMIIHKFLGDSAILRLLSLIAIILIIFIGYGGIVAKIAYKYTTITYVVMPAIGAGIYYFLIDPIITFYPNFIKFASYLSIMIILYYILSITFPVHVLRKLNSKTALVSAFITISTPFFSQILETYFMNYVRKDDLLYTLEAIKDSTEVSCFFKQIILDNPVLVDSINQIPLKFDTDKLTSGIGFVVTATTISYLIGGLLITRTIGKNKSKAKSLYRMIMKEQSLLDYQSLVACSFYGGEAYENLLLNNDTAQKIINENEKNLIIPDISLKARREAWR